MNPCPLQTFYLPEFEEFCAEHGIKMVAVERKYLVVRDPIETSYVTDFILGRVDAEELREKLSHGIDPSFDPDEDLQRVGVAN